MDQKPALKPVKELQVVTCFNHHITDFVSAAKNNDFELVKINEYFDDNNKNNIPRILTMLFKKKKVP
jgi:hypothetical protein